MRATLARMTKSILLVIFSISLIACGANGNGNGPGVPQPTAAERAIQLLADSAAMFMDLKSVMDRGPVWVASKPALEAVDGILTGLGVKVPKAFSPLQQVIDCVQFAGPDICNAIQTGIRLAPGTPVDDFLVSWSNAWFDAIRLHVDPQQRKTRGFVQTVYRGAAAELRTRTPADPKKAAAYRAMAVLLEHLADVVGSRLP